MTIARVSSNDNLYIPQMAQTLPQIENTVHTWHLADGDKAYLICFIQDLGLKQ